MFSASITVVAKGTAKPITKDGVEYLQADKIITKVRVGHGQVDIVDSVRPVAGTKNALLHKYFYYCFICFIQ